MKFIIFQLLFVFSIKSKAEFAKLRNSKSNTDENIFQYKKYL